MKFWPSVGLFLLGCAVLFRAAPASELANDKARSPIGLEAMVDVLEDPSGSLTRDDLQRPDIAARFTHWQSGHDSGAINFGFTRSVWWLRIPLSGTAFESADRMLVIPSSLVEHIEFFAPGKQPVRTGSAAPVSSRPYPHRFFVFPLTPSGQPQVLYLRVASSYALTVPLELWASEQFIHDSTQENFFQAMYFGGLIALIIYNLFIFYNLRDRRFLAYSVFLALFGMGMLAGNGYGLMFVWSESPAFDGVAQSFWVSLAGAAGLCFSSVFLNAKTQAPRLHALLMAFALGFVAVGAYLLVSVSGIMPAAWGFVTLMWIAIPAGVLIMYSAIRIGGYLSNWFLFAWGVLWFGAIVAALRAFGVLPTNTLTAYSLQIASVFEILTLAFALAELINQERKAKEQAQRQVAEARAKLVDSLQASEKKLELTVRDRTEQLTLALHHERLTLDQYLRFGSLVSHEFRNALAIINWQMSLLRKEAEKGVASVAKRVGITLGATERLEELFETWLRGDRIRQSLQHADCQPVETNSWLADVMKRIRHVTEGHVVGLSLQAAPDLIAADAPLLELAVTNLVENACKYSERGTVIRVETLRQDASIGIVIQDQGIGISSEHLDSIFSEYFRISPEGKVRGLGLGLSLAKKVVALHGGRLTVESAPGQGSKFTIWIAESSTTDVTE